MTLDKNTTVEWLSRDENGNYYRDEDLWEDNIEFWVDELARNVNTVGSTWSFHATNVGNIEINGGDYGYSVDKVSEREEVWDLRTRTTGRSTLRSSCGAKIPCSRIIRN